MIESLSIDDGVLPLRNSFKSMLLNNWAVGDPAGKRLLPAPNEPALQEMGEPRKCLVNEAGLNSPVYEPGSCMV